jgi:hypothetical protein
MIRRSWTRVASIEETLALWAASLLEIKKRIRPLFGQERVATNAGLFLEGLLGDEQRKTGWMRAEAAGDPGPWRQQAILGRRDWDAEALRDIVRDYVIRQKPKHRYAVIDPMVNPGSPPHRHQARSKANPTRSYHRMVTLAQSSPGGRSARALQSKKATVMLVSRQADLLPEMLQFHLVKWYDKSSPNSCC